MSKYKYLLSLIAIMTLPCLSSAQATGKSLYEQYQLEIVLGVAALVCLLALVALITVYIALKAVMNANKPQEERILAAVETTEKAGFWRRMWNRLNESVPVEQEATIMTDHEYDGIRELDNRLPPWWLWGFYFTIAFGVVYLLHFHVFKTGNLSQDEYNQEMAQAKAEVEAYLASRNDLIDETTVTFSGDEVDLAAGKELFVSKCSACHGQQGEGGVGPNLTDQYWIHGGDIPSVFKTIKYGVPTKGMIAWQSQLTAKEMQQVTSFIYTMEGTNPPNQKEPQGQLFERTGSTEKQDKDVAEAGI